MRGFSSACRALFDVMLPPRCLLCGRPCGKDDEALCPDCIADLPPPATPHCPLCLIATTYGERCGACQRQPPHFDAARALYRYDFPLDRLIHLLKYRAGFALAKTWGRQLAALTADLPVDLILPLPLHPERLGERGYNQALEIARSLARARGLPCDRESLVKTRATPPQTSLDMKARKKNLRGAFECRRDFSGQTLLLVDDVLTTGATADEAARTLKLHGAARVYLAVVARTGHQVG
ncbi:MAG: ComF family protein [Zoogloeaceae bacterium]|jgi:ComF family protein|nr:ComF family protein [Zoogloeaceae bacterium]